MARIVKHVFNLSFMPQALAPLYEQATNRLMFFDRPIETEAMQGRQPFARSNEYTSKTMRALGEATKDLPPELQVSPARMEALLRGYLNAWAMYGLTLSDAAFFDHAPDMRTDQYPVLRRFYSDTPARHSRYSTELYELIEEATETRRTVSWLAKGNRTADMAEPLYDEPANLRYRQMGFANEQMQRFSKQMESIAGETDIEELRGWVTDYAKSIKEPGFAGKVRMSKDWNDTGALKRYLIDRIIQDRNEFARSVVQDVEAQKKAVRK